jgi:hypothetical protein
MEDKIRQKHHLSLEERLKALPRRRFVLLVTAVGFLFVALGAVLGILLAPHGSASSGADSGNSSDDASQEETSYTGVLRQFFAPEDGIEFYLEEADDTRVLLDFSSRFDPAFIEDTYVGTVVTVKGEMGKSDNGFEDVFMVEEIVIKR